MGISIFGRLLVACALCRSLAAALSVGRPVATKPASVAEVVGGVMLAGAVVLGGSQEAGALQPADVVELTDAAYPIIKQLKPTAFQPFVDKVADLILQAGDLDAAVDTGLDYFNSMPTDGVKAAVAAAYEGLDAETCTLVPLPTRATFDRVATKALAKASPEKVKKFEDLSGPIVGSFVRKDDLVCLPPVEKLEKAALAQADAAKAANVAMGTAFNKQAYKTGGTIPKGPAIKLFTSYDAAKQTLGASSGERKRFELAGKKIEAAATALSRQALYQ